jgi:hypothetical protein
MEVGILERNRVSEYLELIPRDGGALISAEVIRGEP